jgi:hypothetical protein
MGIEPTLYNVYRGSFTGSKAPDAVDSLPPFRAELKNE